MSNKVIAIGVCLVMAASACSTSDKAANPAADSSAASASASNATPGQAPRAATGEIPGQYIVMLRAMPGALASRAQQTTEMATSLLDRVGAGRASRLFVQLRGFLVQNLDSLRAREMGADPRVLRIVPDRYVSISSDTTSRQSNPPWGLDRIDAAAGLDHSFSYVSDGAGVDVYVIDTGINTAHQQFEGRADIWWDVVGDGQNGQDCNGHGSHVAGTIAGKDYGVAKKARLHAARVLGCDGRGAWSTVIAAIDSLTRLQLSTPNRHKLVANMSLGSDGALEPLDSSLARASRADIVFVVAAGNDATDACQQSPAHSPAPIRVAALDRDDRKASFSNDGDCVDLFAPGVDILSAWSGGGNASRSISGTSMAAPHVSGVVAQLLSRWPTTSAQRVRDSLEMLIRAHVNGASARTNGILFTNY